ncbi:albumin-like [Dendropsophus ebraccatus]|uniref:albumin-like n=1 Tax=Dendropsophus ebraccatus TaxID=150705 RepID=UPI003832146B
MKLVTLICLLLCTIVTESRHLQKRDAEHHSRHIGQIYVTVGENNFKHLMIVILAQSFQGCSVEEHEKEADEFTAFAKDCADHEEKEECKKPMITIFHDKMCNLPGLKDRYPWSETCCPMAEPEREKCFHDHRDIIEEEYQPPEAEAACKNHKEHHEHAYHLYIDSVAKRHPSMYPPAVLGIADQYDHLITECCAAEEKAKCFQTKFPEIVKTTLYIEHKQKHVCHILSKFPERVYSAMKIAKISQKHPAASFETVQKFTAESLHMSKDCCKGDVVECMVERMEYTQHICDNKEKLSPNLAPCCEKPLLERTPCIMALPKDDIPADLPKEIKEFVEDEHVCKNFADHKDVHLAKFLHEFSRRHQELSVLSLLRVGKGYEGVLTKCCAQENSLECLKPVHEMLATGIKDSQALIKQNCDIYEHVGPYGYHIVLLQRYVPRMPQVSDKTLYEITGKMAKFAGKCCALPENQRMSCAEDKLDLLLGEMCAKQDKTFINDQVRHCCNDNYSERRPCFAKLGVDPSYKAPAFDEGAFQVGAEICEGTEDQQKEKRLALLTHVLKTKPDISTDKMKGTIGEFSTVREKCCAAADRQLCFNTERPTLLLHLKEALAH